MAGVAKGAGSQSTGLHEINLGVGQLDQVTQRNAAMVQTATTTSEDLAAEADALVRLVSRFNLDVDSVPQVQRRA